jgi:NADH-quinone oxidoreductase subunit N
MVAACFSLFLVSLLGLPATGGFVGKFFAFQAALGVNRRALVLLVVIAAINTIIGAYYYLRVIITMYFQAPHRDYAPTPVPSAVAIALVIAAAGTLYLGILPSRVFDLAQAAAVSLFPH